MTRPKPWNIRRATGADAAAAASMHVRTWQIAYRDIIPGPFLDSLDVAVRASRYSFDRRGPRDPATWIAVDGDHVVGMVSVGPSRDEDLRGLGEVHALYVAPERWGSGAGSALMTVAERLLAEDGFDEALLWVLRDNARGRGFYEAAGWIADGQAKSVRIGGSPVVEVRYRKTLVGRDPGPRG